MSDYDHPASRDAMRHGIEAEKAERRHDLRGKHYYNHLAAECEAEVARAATDERHKALIWSSAVAYAYHANDLALFQRLAAEALRSSENELMKAEILEMLADPQVQPVVLFGGFRAKSAAVKNRTVKERLAA